MKALKYALIFIAGAGVGTGVSAYLFKKKYEKLVKEKDKELEQMDEYYKEKCSECGVADEDKEEDVQPVDLSKEENIEEYISSHPEKPEKRQGSFATDYSAYYEKTDPAESEHPREEEEPIRVAQQPKLIRAASFGNDGYSQRVLYYYTEDDALIPEGGSYDDIVDTDEVKDTIGNALIKYGFADVNNLERDIFVRNFDRQTDYHIIKVVGSLSEDYGG